MLIFHKITSLIRSLWKPVGGYLWSSRRFYLSIGPPEIVAFLYSIIYNCKRLFAIDFSPSHCLLSSPIGPTEDFYPKGFCWFRKRHAYTYICLFWLTCTRTYCHPYFRPFFLAVRKRLLLWLFAALPVPYSILVSRFLQSFL